MRLRLTDENWQWLRSTDHYSCQLQLSDVNGTHLSVAEQYAALFRATEVAYNNATLLRPKSLVSLADSQRFNMRVLVKDDAVSADYSFIVPSGTMIIHPVRTSGMFIGVAQSLRNIEKTQDRITGFLAEHSGMSQERIEELMLDSTQLVKDVGTMLEGKRAVEEGLIDEVGGIRDALNKLHEMIDEKMENTDKNYEMT